MCLNTCTKQAANDLKTKVKATKIGRAKMKVGPKGNTNSCLAELYALRDGLNFASNLGILYIFFNTI